MKKQVQTISFLILCLIFSSFSIQIQAQKKENTNKFIKSIIDKDEKTALALIEDGIFINGDTPQNNPLINAIYNSSSNIIKILIQKGASVTETDADGISPLMAATIMGDTSSITLLMQYKADPFLASTKGYNSFDLAIYSKSYLTSQHLLANFLSTHKNYSKTDIQFIIQMAKGKKLNSKVGLFKNEIAHLALIADNTKQFFNIVDSLQFDPKVTTYTNLSALDISFNSKRKRIARKLIENGFPLETPNKMGKFPIAYLSPVKDKPLYLFCMNKILVKTAKKRRERKIIKQINKAKVKIKKRYKLSPEFKQVLMEYVIVSEQDYIFKQLLDNGFNVNGKTNLGINYLSFAIQNKNILYSKQLLNHGANLFAQNDNTYQTTALMEAASTGQVDMGKYLLKRGARINFGDINNDPALNYAVYHGHFAFVKFLLKNKADTNMAGQAGYTPLLTAKAHGYTKIVRILEKYKIK